MISAYHARYQDTQQLDGLFYESLFAEIQRVAGKNDYQEKEAIPY